MTEVLLEKDKADVNRILFRYHATPLFNAAAQGYVEVVRYCLKSYSADIRFGSRKFDNGPTALHNQSLNAAVNNAIAKRNEGWWGDLLKHRGAVKSLGGATGICAEKRLRSNSSNQDKKLQTREALKLVVDDSGIGCMENIQIRRMEEILKGVGIDLMSLADADDDEEGERQDYGSENVEPSVKSVRQLGWLEMMGLEPEEEPCTPVKPKHMPMP